MDRHVENGRFVAFTTVDALVPGDTSAFPDVHVKSLGTGAVVHASITAAGVQPNNQSFQPQLSAHGRFVAFSSWASNLAPVRLPAWRSHAACS